MPAPRRLLPLLVCLVVPAAVDAEPGAPKLTGMRYLDNGTIKLGVDLDKGGSITYLAGKDGTNLINSFDLGRQVQLSFYSGPNPFIPAGKEISPAWTTLGWNPIQTGDAFGHPSKILEFSSDANSLHLKCVPMHWPLNNVPAECTFEVWVTLKDNVVLARARLNNARPDKIWYGARNQELPAVYTNGPYTRLLTYSGDKPFTGDALRQIKYPIFSEGKNRPWAGWLATEHWAALVDDKDYGVGVFSPESARFSGGYAGKPGRGGPKDDPCGYLAPNEFEILDHNIQYEFSYRLIVGTLKDIRAWVYANAPRPSPPAWAFAADRQHWTYHQAKDTGWPIKDALHVLPEGKDPQLLSPQTFWQAADAPILTLVAACRLKDPHAQIFLSPAGDDRAFAPAHRLDLPLIPDGEYHTYHVNLAASAEYRGGLMALRIDPTPEGSPGDWIKIKSIRLGKEQ